MKSVGVRSGTGGSLLRWRRRRVILTQSPAELQLKLKHHEQLGWKVDNISPFHPSHLHLAAPVAPRVDRQATPSTSRQQLTSAFPHKSFTRSLSVLKRKDAPGGHPRERFCFCVSAVSIQRVHLCLQPTC